MDRMMVFDHTDAYLCDVDQTRLRSADYKQEVNGEHSITLTTTQELEKTNRLLMRDGMGIWHEYVIIGVEARHVETGAVWHEYYAIWSLQYDLSATFVNDMYGCGYVPGHASVPQQARRALEVSLEGTDRWQIGTVTVTTMASASFYRRSGWEALQTVLERWGGELRATITVGQDGVTSRSVDLLKHVGTVGATRRFDYGHDVSGIKRTLSDDIWPCRIIPLGKSQETDAGGHTRRPDISSVNGGVFWLHDSSVANDVRVPKPNGGWEYPTMIVKNDTYEEPADLYAWALEHYTEYTAPKVSYEAEVVQFERAGLSAHGVALGDDVVVVDRTFGTGGLRIQARVVAMQGSLLDPADTKLTIGNGRETLGGQMGSLSGQIGALADIVDNSGAYISTAEYVSNLLAGINEAINATGGYTYITEGYGLRTYDRPVSDPLVGSEATRVVEIKGGNIRIANSRTQAGDWDWKTVLTSGHIAAELVTAAQITAGFIGNASGGSYWDLDQNTLVIGSGASIAGRTPQAIATGIDDAAKVATNYLTYSSGDGLNVGYSGTNARTNVSGSGVEIFDGNGDSAVFAGIDSGSSVVRVGKSTVGHALVDYRSMRLIDSNGDEYLDISDLRNEDGELVFTETVTTIYNQQSSFPTAYEPERLVKAVVDGTDVTSKFWIRYGAIALRNGQEGYPVNTRITFTYVTVQEYCRAFMFGTRDESSISGPMSVSFGTGCVASGGYTLAFGNGAKASGSYAIAMGANAEASGHASCAIGEGTRAVDSTDMAIGHWNADGGSGYSYSLIVGNGTQSARKNCLTLNMSGNLWIAGTLTQNSDRRLKEHHAYLGEDACDFVRSLKPALYTKDGERHVGFYAQDVAEAEPEGWETVTVTAQHTDESLGYDPLTLDYSALIAPLVAYAQGLERRVERQQAQIDALAGRVAALEERNCA